MLVIGNLRGKPDITQSAIISLRRFPSNDETSGLQVHEKTGAPEQRVESGFQMGLTGLESVTSPSSGARSSQLSYRPLLLMAGEEMYLPPRAGATEPLLPVPDGPYKWLDEVLDAHHADRLRRIGVDHDRQLDTGLPHPLQGLERGGRRGDLDGGSDQGFGG